MQIIISSDRVMARTHRHANQELADETLKRNGYKRATVWRTDITNTLLFAHLEQEPTTTE